VDETQTFGKLIRQARKEQGYSQRQLAALLEVDFTYLSKLENDRADYPPKEDVIRGLARNLGIDEEELIFLAGRIPVASANAQGRSYLIQTNLEAKPEPFGTVAHEIVLRTDNRVMLVQIVHGERVDDSIDEMTQALRSILVY